MKTKLTEVQPIDLEPMTLDELGALYEYTDAMLEEHKDALVEIKKTIFDKMETDSEEVGNYLAYVARTPKFPELTLEKARDLGLTKVEEKIDNTLVKKAYNAGAKLGKVEWGEAMVMRKRRVEE